MKRALVLNAIDMRIGGVLIRGERGTGKSTAARALAVLLPEIDAIADSPYNDDPRHPETWSDEVRERYADSPADGIPVTRRKIRFVDLPVSATEHRVVGTLDIEKAIQKGERHFDPGVLAAANRDPSRWERPDEFDPGRPIQPHLGFGTGAHICLGSHVARAEIVTAIGALLDRFPDLRLDPDAPAPRITGMYERGPTSVPVRF